MTGFPIKNVVVERAAYTLGLTDGVLNRLPGIPVQKIDIHDPELLPSHPSALGKDTLQLVKYKGEFFKPCPGTKEYICCGYQILNVATNCPLDCSYCILQSYFNQPNVKIFANLEQGIGPVLSHIDSHPEEIFRVGTGEFTDSLALDNITHWSDLLFPLFSQRKNVVLEVKTKTSRIERLISSMHRDRIVVSWSLNSPLVTSREEHNAAPLKKRLKAAKQCQAEGFILGFHFDPLIAHPKWKEGYMRTLDVMHEYIEPKGIIWISLGSFRFMPGLKSIIRRRHPNSRVLDGEFVRGLDGKMRYFKPIRMELYSFMREQLEKWLPNSGLYLCMESDDVWEKVMGWSPRHSIGLKSYLDSRVVEIFG